MDKINVRMKEDFTVTMVPEGVILKKGDEGVLGTKLGFSVVFGDIVPAIEVKFAGLSLCVPMELLEVVQ